MPDMPADSLDRLLAGELSRSEERRLAQAALDDPELFDALTAAAVAKAGLASADVASDSAKAPTPAVTVSRPDDRHGCRWRSSQGSPRQRYSCLAVASGWRSGSPAPSQPAASSDSTPAAVARGSDSPERARRNGGYADLPVGRGAVGPFAQAGRHDPPGPRRHGRCRPRIARRPVRGHGASGRSRLTPSRPPDRHGRVP